MPPTAKPNILVVMSDQHSARVAGCYGDDIIRTPNMDRLAREGTRFDRCYCPAPVCVPSRMAFMSGRRPGENRVVTNADILSSSILTWPARLTEAGYHTALIGRMHFEGPDQFHGFETTYEDLRHWRGNRPVENQCETPRVPNWSYWSPREAIEQLAGSGSTFVQFRDERVTERGCDFLRQKAGGADDRPFAAVVGLYNPHPPYVGRRDLYEYYYDRVEPPDDTLDLMPDYLADYYRTYHNWQTPSPIEADAKRRALAAYYANVEHVDEQLGAVLGVLDETGLARDTLVIYCSDHGDMLGRKGAWGKNTVYDEAARVPMIARLPGVVPAGETSKRCCNLRDLGNTFCDIAGAEPLRHSDAPSLAPTLRGQPTDAPDPTESELVENPTCFGQDEWAAYKMVRQEQWKLWCYHIAGRDHYSLFDLEADPDELNDRIADPTVADRVAQMKTDLHRGWDPQRLISDAALRREDRRETDGVWQKVWQPAGYTVPEDVDADVDTPHTRDLATQSVTSGG